MHLSRYTFQCQRVIYKALQYARSLGHEAVEVEHVALAMLRSNLPILEDIPVTALLKERLERYLSALERRFGPFETRYSQRLMAALDDAEKSLPNVEIDFRELFQFLEKNSPEMQHAIRKIQADQERIRNFVPIHEIEKKSAQSKSAKASSGDVKESISRKNQSQSSKPLDEKFKKFLDTYTTDLTGMAERGELDPVLGRDQEVRRIIQVLGRRKKNNPILLGEPGVGKTAIVEAVALRIAAGKVPQSMQGKRLLRLDLGALLAGAKFRGEFEERMKNLLAAAAALKGQAIFFIDEIHMLVGAGNNEGGADAANLMKPALARGEIATIGATTLDEFKKHIEPDSALERRFQPVFVEEPSAAVSIAMLRGVKAKYEIHHGVKINDGAIIAAVNLSVRYLPARKLPDKAIDLLDEAATRLRYEIDSLPAEMEELRGRTERLKIEREAIGNDKSASRSLIKIDVELGKAERSYDELEKVWREHLALCEEMAKLEASREEYIRLFEQSKDSANYEFAARLQFTEMPQIDAKLSAAKAAVSDLQHKHSFLKQEVRDREVAEVISSWTGIPMTRVLEEESTRLKSLHERLAGRVIGQMEAVASVCRAIRRMRAGISSSNRPMGVLMFLGPTGVGKTELARAIASEVFSHDAKILRFDMSEFMEQHQVARLIGAPPGYVGFGTGGELTEGLKHRPHSLVLLDEVEKAHPKVFDILLQVFEDGRITDGTGHVVRANNALFVMTSNLNVDRALELEHQDKEFGIRHELRKFFRPELINRIDEIIRFRDLGAVDYEKIVGNQLAQLNETLLEKNLRVGLTDRAKFHIVQYGLLARSGGRGIRRAFERFVIDALADRMVDESNFSGSWTLDWIDGRPFWKVEYEPQRYLPAARDA